MNTVIRRRRPGEVVPCCVTRVDYARTRITPENAARLAHHVKARRTQLGLTWRDVGAGGGPTWSTLARIESAEQVKRLHGDTLRRLDVGLEWAPGSAKAVLDGGEPTPIDEEQK